MRLTQNGAALTTARTPHDRERAISVLRRAVDLGVNHIDTAAFYFSPMSSANELINRALGPYPDDLVITTKVGPGRGCAATGWTGPGRRTCAARSRRTSASSAATTSTWSTSA